jgi:polysaccharide pyruvyl transferase WcaK-like protein
MKKNNLKIFIKGAHDSYNFGDDLIFIGILYFLEKNLRLNNENCELYINRKKHSFEKLNYKPALILKNSIDVINIIKPVKLQLKSLKFPKFLRLFFAILIIIIFYINIYLFRIFKKSLFFKDIISFFDNLDVLHYIGGGYITDRWKERILLEYLTVSVAKIINPDLKIIGTGLGLGPFRSKPYLLLVKRFLNKFDYLFLREKISFELVKKLNINSFIRLYGDDALLLFPLFKSLKQKSIQVKPHKKIIALNLKDFLDHNYIKIKKDIEKTLKLLQMKNFKIHYFCFGEKPGPNDYARLSIFHSKFKKNLVIHKPYKEGLYKFIKNLHKVNFGIGFAYHFNLILSIMGISTLAIFSGDYYRQKIKGAMNFFGKSSDIFSINDLQKLRFKNSLDHLEKLKKKNMTDSNIEKLYINMLKGYSHIYKKIINKT